MAPECALCGRAAAERCGGCQEAHYCGEEHQRQHWPAHRRSCSPYEVAQDAVLGRHLVATRDLPAGAVVLREAPLATGPPADARAPVCAACYRALPAAAPPLCPRACGWPLCGPACAALPRHRPECALQAARGAPADVVGALRAGRPVHRALTVARCLLLRDSAPAAYARLRGLEAHCALRRASGQWEREREHLAAFLLPFFGLQARFSEDDVLYMAGVLQINTYPVRVREPPPFVAVYDEASFIEHTCVPNTAKLFGADGSLLLRTAAPVRRGEHLSICYVDAALATAPRRAALRAELLECACARCADASEMGTGFGALLCDGAGCAGALQPERPLAEGGAWRCDACGRRAAAAEAAALAAAGAAAADALPPAELLRRAPALRLGPSHSLLLRARLGAACDGPPAAQRADAELRATEGELRALRRLLDTLLPAEMGLRGRVQLALHDVLLEAELRRARRGAACAEGLCARVKEAKRLLEEAASSLAGHADGSPEAALHARARRQLEAFDAPQEGPLARLRGAPAPAPPSASAALATAAS